MAKKSSIEKNNRRRKMVAQFANKRAELKTVAKDESLTLEERFQARLKLAELPRNSSAVRIRNRCEITGRPRGYYRKLEDVAHRAARSWLRGPDPRPGQVELVRRAIR